MEKVFQSSFSESICMIPRNQRAELKTVIARNVERLKLYGNGHTIKSADALIGFRRLREERFR